MIDDGWKEVPVDSDGWQEVPVDSKPKSGLAKLWEHAKKKNAEIQSKPLKDRILSAIGNTAVGGIPDLKQAIDVIPEDWTTARSVLSVVNKVLPSQSVAGAVKGTLDIPLGVAQSGAHLFSGNTSGIDRAVQSVSDYFKNNFNESKSGELAAQAVPFALSGGLGSIGEAGAIGSRLSPKALRLLNFIKPVVEGAAITPAITAEADLKNPEEYAKRKKLEAAIGGGLPLALQVVSPTLKKVSSTPSVQEAIEAFKARFGGGDTADAFVSAGQRKLSSARATASKAYAPVDRLAKTQNVAIPEYENALYGTIANSDNALAPIPSGQYGMMKDLLNRATDPNIEKTFSKGMEAVSQLGERARISRAAGELQDATRYEAAREALLADLDRAGNNLSPDYANARATYFKEVVPLTDPAQGGDLLHQLRNPTGQMTPDKVLKKAISSSPDQAAIYGRGADSNPMLSGSLERAFAVAEQAGNDPAVFVRELNKHMKVIEAVGSPEDVATIKNIMSVAQTSQNLGYVANAVIGHQVMGAPGVLAAVASRFPGVSRVTNIPARGIWAASQSPVGRGLAGAVPDPRTQLGDYLTKMLGIGARELPVNQ